MRTVVAILDARIDGFVSKMAAAGKAAADMPKQAQRGMEVLKDTAMQNEQAWNNVSNTMGAVGIAAGAVAGLAVKEFSQFDKAMSGVASTGADAKKSIDALRDAALKQGADTAFSATEAAQGIEELAKAGVSATEILGGGLAGALSLAAAGEIDVAEAAEIASIAMTQFKLSGDQIPHVADLLAAGAGKAMGSVGELGAALKQSGLVASQFGLGIEETVGGLSAFAAGGLLGSDAGTSFKNMLLKLAKPSKEAQRTLDELGISAYDAQGNFVGLEGLAGQLKAQMQELDPATRQAAMATIFGTDAIRAASILYENGADGIARWTAAVDDAGYAAEVAATLQDNLAGDLEKLGGAWSTLAIQMGEGTNSGLRGAVQALEALVDAAGKTPGAAAGIMAGTVALAALAGGGALLMKGISGYAQFQTALATLSAASPGIGKTATAVGKLGAAAGVLAGAYVAFQALNVVIEALSAHGPGLDETAAALTRVANGAGGIDSLDLLFRDAIDPTREITSGVGDLATAFEVLGKYENFGDQIWSNFFNADPNAKFGEASAHLDTLRERFETLDTALQGMSIEESATAFASLNEKLNPDGSKLPQMLELFDGYAAKVDAAAAAAGLAKPSHEELATLMSGGMVEGFSLSAAAAGEFGDASAEAATQAELMAAATQEEHDSMMDVIDAANGARDAIQSLNDTQTSAANAFLSSQAAGDAYIATLQAINGQIKGNGRSLDEYTEKGRANREYLRGLAVDARTAGDAMIMNGEGIGAANTKMGEMRGQFIGILGKFGIVSSEAEAFADSVGLIPNYVETVIAAPGAKLSKQEADDLNASLEGLPEEVKTQIITIAQLRGANEAKSALAAIKDKTVSIGTTFDSSGVHAAKASIQSVTGKTVTIRTHYDTSGSTAPGVPTVGRAGGGPVYGPGTTTSDSIPAMLSNREWVLRAWAADKIGYDRLAYMNATGKIPHFSNGGEVGGRATTGAYSSFTSPQSVISVTTGTGGQGLDPSTISTAVAAGMANARIFMDGKEINARIETSLSRTARQVTRGAK